MSHPDAHPLADPDGDGIPNLLEYALGGNPLIAGSAFPVTSQINNNRLQITFLRAANDVIYEIEASNDLIVWEVIATNPGEVGDVITLEDVLPLSENSRRFLRLHVRVDEL